MVGFRLTLMSVILSSQATWTPQRRTPSRTSRRCLRALRMGQVSGAALRCSADDVPAGGATRLGVLRTSVAEGPLHARL